MLESFNTISSGVLNCSIAYNQYGAYCVPNSSKHRPAAKKILSGDIWEPLTIEYIVNNSLGGDVVHAGAYFGDFIPALSKSLEHASKLWVFEPNPENFRCAFITVLLNDLSNVELFNFGLGCNNTSLPMQVVDENGRSLGGGSQILCGVQPIESTLNIKINVVRLDDYFPADRHTSIIQFDVEGFEEHALEGSMETIKRCRPILILENLPSETWALSQIYNMGYSITGKVHENYILRPDNKY